VTLRPLLQADFRLSMGLRVAEKPGLRRVLAAILAHSGDSWFWGIGLIAVWWFSGAEWKAWAVRLLLSIAALAVVVMTIKLLVRRSRPAGDWGAIYRSTDPHSFPSGHAARAVLLATLATAWGPGWLAPWLWLWAPLVSLARVAMGVHFLSDVVAGGVLGLVAALIAVGLVH